MVCFRKCDIRGQYPEEVDENLFYRIGGAIISGHAVGTPVLVGRDARSSSESLQRALIKGLVDWGAHVLDAGMIPSPMLYFGRTNLRAAFAAMVTASHNPPNHNGLKLLGNHSPASDREIAMLRRSVVLEREPRPGGTYERIEIKEQYYTSFVARWKDLVTTPGIARRRRFILDPGNGAWSGLAAALFHRLGIPCATIHDEPDGRFPNRPPDCAAFGSLARLSQSVCSEEAAAGFAWDGDGDRLAVCDERGCPVSSDQLALLLLPELLEPGIADTILIDVKLSRKIWADIEARGSIAIIEKSAHCALERTMIRRKCRFGCEYNGHYFFRELGGSDDAMFTALLVVAALQKHSESLSELVRKQPVLWITPEIRISGGAGEYHAIRRSLTAAFSADQIDCLDGLKVNFPGGWFLVRPSVSEEKLSFRFEGDTAQELERVVRQALRLMPQHAARLSSLLSQRYRNFSI
jgi:phosphomannomutase/phosphoglucomutase